MVSLYLLSLILSFLETSIAVTAFFMLLFVDFKVAAKNRVISLVYSESSKFIGKLELERMKINNNILNIDFNEMSCK